MSLYNKKICIILCGKFIKVKNLNHEIASNKRTLKKFKCDVDKETSIIIFYQMLKY